MPDESTKFRFNFWENSRGSTKGLQPEMLSVIPRIAKIFREQTGNPHFQVVITAGQEWHYGHKLMSLHHTGYAVDFQTKLLTGGGTGEMAKAVERAIRADLGPKYRVELETKPPHIHVEFSAGVKMSNPGDFPPPTTG